MRTTSRKDFNFSNGRHMEFNFPVPSHSNTVCNYFCYLSVSLFERVTFPDIYGFKDVYITSVSILYETYCSVSNIPVFHIWRIVSILRLAPYLLNSGGITDAQICHSGDICKIFCSRYCVSDLCRNPNGF